MSAGPCLAYETFRLVRLEDSNKSQVLNIVVMSATTQKFSLQVF
jgi:hypothetical protein